MKQSELNTALGKSDAFGIRNGNASRIRHLIDRVRATMVALEAGLSTGTPLGHDTPQTLALVAVELSRYVSIYDEEVKKR